MKFFYYFLALLASITSCLGSDRQVVVVYRSQFEADSAEWWYSHPEAILWFIGGGLFLILALYFWSVWLDKKK